MSTSLFTRRVRWTDVARLLDVGYESPTLPALVTCPLCQGHTLRVYEDRAVRGAWFHCTACDRGGDGLSFAALVWDVDVAGAVARFIAGGLLPASAAAAVPGYETRVVGQRKRLDEFWATASRHLPGWESPGAARLVRAVGLNTDLPIERWRAGLGTLVGAAPSGAATLAVHCAADHKVRVFRGRGWQDVLVLPYHSSAGRLSGFTFVGRGARPEDRVFAAALSNADAARKDAGLYGPHAAEGNQTVVAVRDDLLALRLHSRNFSTSGRFLGLVAWLDDGTHATGRSCWQQLNGKRVVHWVRGIDAAVIRQAFFFEADISLAAPGVKTPGDLLTYCRHGDPPDVLRRVVRQARPWRHALSDWLVEAHGGAVEVLAAQLTAYGIDAHEIARSLSDREAAAKLHELGGPGRFVPGVRYAHVGHGTVETRSDGWYYLKPTAGGRQETVRISDFTLTVRQIRILPDREVYECDVFYRGRRHSVELNPKQLIDRQLLRAGVGLVYVAPRWTRKLLGVAATFHNPVIVKEE